jgi:hypothetical protein
LFGSKDVVSRAYNELADFVGPASGEDGAVPLFMALSIFREIRKESEATDATFDNPGPFLNNGDVLWLVDGPAVALLWRGKWWIRTPENDLLPRAERMRQ